MILIVPSRGRPKRAANMVQSARVMAAKPVTIVVAVDPDDAFLEEYKRKVKETVVLPDRLGYAKSLNAIAKLHPDEDIFGAFGDDVLFRTVGWDERVRETLQTPGMAFPNDLAHRQNWPTAVFVSKAIVDALGYLALPAVWHQYADNAWKAIGDALGILRYMDDVIVEHMHEAYGKSENDATYREVYSEPQATLSYIAFKEWEADHMFDDVEKVRAVLA